MFYSSSVPGQRGPHQSRYPRRHRDYGGDRAPLQPPVLRERGGTPEQIDLTKPFILSGVSTEIEMTLYHLHPGTHGVCKRPRIPELQPVRTSPPTGGMQKKSTDVQSAEGPFSRGCQNMPKVHG